MALKGVYGFVGNPIDAMEQLKVERKLTDQEIDQLGIQLVTAGNSKELLGWPEPNTLIQIPYWGITREKLLDNRGQQLFRCRRTVANDRGERYTQRKGTGSRHFFPRLAIIDWHSIAKDPSIPVFYTEGEFKAIAGCKNLGPTIGNAGVNAWRGPESSLASPLDEVLLENREVLICYDAESTSTAAVPLKATVAKALGELAVDLMQRGAIVKMLLIAKTSVFVEGVKMGLDDYFAAGGTREELLATAVDPEVDPDWLRMFTDYAIYQGTRPHIKKIVGDLASYTPKEFREMVERKSRVVDGKPKKIADIYREHDLANTFNEYIFDPKLEPGYLKNEQKFNTWQGFKVGATRSAGYESNINDYLQFQTGVLGAEHIDYYLDWAAHLFQRPWEFTTISPILVSRVKGVGKSLSGGIIRSLIGRKGAFRGSIEGLTEKHTGELEGKLFVQIDEADALFGGKENKLKELDSDEIRIRKMNTDGYTVPNYLRKFYTTNENAAFRIAEDERRYWVVTVDKGAEDGLEDSEWSVFQRTKIGPRLEDEEFLGDLMWFFMNRDLSASAPWRKGEAWDPKKPVPQTEAMRDMVMAGETKKDVMADQLYAKLSEMGVWATNADIVSIDNKLWAQVKTLLKDNRGRSAQAAYKTEGQTKYCSVWMTKDRLLPTIEDSKKGPRLAPNLLGGAELKDMLLKTRKVFDDVRAIIDSGKF